VPHPRVNHAAIAVATIVFWAFGGAWYTLLSVPWLAATGRTAAQVQRYGMLPFVAAIALCWLASYTVATLLRDSGRHNARHGARLGAFLGIGIYGTIGLMTILFEGHDLMLFAIDGGYGIVGLALVGAVIGALKPGAASA